MKSIVTQTQMPQAGEFGHVGQILQAIVRQVHDAQLNQSTDLWGQFLNLVVFQFEFLKLVQLADARWKASEEHVVAQTQVPQVRELSD